MKWRILCISLLMSAYSTAQVTYHEHIAPIIKQKCQSCHQNDDIGPIAFTTYEDVASYASMIKFVTDIQLMPPFKADHTKVDYANERSLTAEEKQHIAQWIEGGLMEGQAPRAKPRDTISAMSHYDYSVCMEAAFEHYGIYYDQYQVFPLAINLPEGKYVKEVIFEPGNKKIVRSANISLAPMGASSKMDKWDPRYGFFAYGSLGFEASAPHWYSWMPHTASTRLRSDDKLYLPAQSEMLLHIHYGPYGEIQKDSSCIHLKFEDRPHPILQNVPLVHQALHTDTFLIEEGLKRRVTTAIELPIDINLRSVTPLAHLLCTTWEVFAVLPDRTSVPLLSIADWDFHWREKYIFKDVIHLPKGTKIYTTATYDNTRENPYNPSDPPRTMKAGPHMYDENFVCYFEIEARDSKAMIHKPGTVYEAPIREVAFDLTQEGTYHIQSVDTSTGISQIISEKQYTAGRHTVQSSILPNTKGVYVISIQEGEIVLDAWWVVVM